MVHDDSQSNLPELDLKMDSAKGENIQHVLHSADVKTCYITSLEWVEKFVKIVLGTF